MSRSASAGRGDRLATLLQNDDEAELKHVTRLLTHPPAIAAKEILVVTWRGGWLCTCGRICWAKQHCKACGHWSPCRDWLFTGGCHKHNCKFDHPQFFLPRQRPEVGPDGLTAADGEPLLQLPPPGSVPAVELARRKRAAAAAAAAAPAATPAAAAAAAAPAAAAGTASADKWAELEARARAAMGSAIGSAAGSAASSRGATPVPAAAHLPLATAVAAPPPRQHAAVAASPLQPAAPPPAGEDEAEVAEYLALLGIA